MKYMKRISAVLLALVLALPPGLITAYATEAAPAAASPKTALFSVGPLGWKDTTGAYGSVGNYTVQSVAGISGGTSLQLTTTNSNWSAIQILSPEQMQGQGAYTVSMQLRIDSMDSGIIGWRVGSPSADINANGDWIAMCSPTSLENRTYPSSSTDAYATVTRSALITLAAEVRPSEGKILAYYNGALVATNTGASSAVGGIWLMLGGPSAASAVYTVDNVQVTQGTYAAMATANVIYSEDFEGYAPYEARQSAITAGTVLYEENFGTEASSAVPARITRPSGYNTGGETANLVLGAAGDAHLNYEMTTGDGGNWHSFEVVPAGAMVGVRQFTVRYSAKLDYVPAGMTGSGNWMGGMYLRFGAASANSGTSNWLFLSSGNYKGALSDYIVFKTFDSDMHDLAEKVYPTGTVVGSEQKFAVEVDLDAQTARVFMNDMETPILTVSGIYNADGGIQFVMKDTTKATLDDVSVTAGGINDRPAVYNGVQESAAVDGKYNVRFVGTLGNKYQPSDYEAVGFRIVASYGEGQTKVFDASCTTLYNSILATRGINKTYTAQDFDATYIFAYTVVGIPVSAGEVTFTVTPYFTTANGKAEGSCRQVAYNAGTYIATTLVYPAASSVPAYPASYTNVTVEGDADMMYAASTTPSQFDAYAAALEAAGFEKYDDYTVNNNRFYTYVSKNVTVTCSYFGSSSSGEARIVTDIGMARAPRAQENRYTASYSTLLTQVGLNNLKENNGMSYVLRLADGRFLVFDGGSLDHDEDEKLYDLLLSQTPTGEKPVIAAWFLSHGHEDHYGAFLAFAHRYLGKVEIRRAVYNLPTSALAQNVYDESKVRIDTRIQAIPGVEITYARSGQRFYIADAEIDVLLTPEDFYPTPLTSAEENEASVVYRVLTQGQSILLLGDSEDRGAEKLCSHYGSALKSDIMQQAHHGYWAGSPALYSYIDPETVLWPSPNHWYYEFYDGSHGTDANATIHNSANVKEIILAGNGTRTLTLPYTPAVATRPETEVYSYRTGDVIYSNDFEATTRVYETGWYNIDTNDNEGHDGASGLNRDYTALSLLELDGDRGILLNGKGGSAVLGIVRPELLRNTDTYTLDMELNVYSLGSGFSVWYNDAEPVGSTGRSLYEITQNGRFRFTLEVGRSESKVYINGEYLTTVSNQSSAMGGLQLFLEGGVTVFIGAVKVVAGSADAYLNGNAPSTGTAPSYEVSGEGSYADWNAG